MNKKNTTLDNIFNVIFLLLLVFLGVGTFLPAHREQATLGVLILISGWVMSKIIQEGLQSLFFFFEKKEDHDDNDTHNKED
jgi:hypothetical protein